MDINTEYLAKLHPNLSIGDPHIDGAVAVELVKWEKAIAKVGEINPDLKAEVIAAQRASIVGEALDAVQTKITEILSDDSELYAIHQNLAQATLSEPAKDYSEALQIADDRMALRGMSISERSALLRDDVAKGSRRILNALKGSIDLAKGINIALAEDSLIRVSRPDLIKDVKAAEEKSIKKKSALQAASYAISKIAYDRYKIDVEKELEVRKNIRRASFQKLNWSDRQKSEYIGVHGPDAFRRLVAGEVE